jgi:hypothetical protein
MFDPIRPPLVLESPTMPQGVLTTGCSSDIWQATAERANTARSSRIRCRVTPSARLLIGRRALLTDDTWDRFPAPRFLRPGDG